jgi:hypothetical protein
LTERVLKYRGLSDYKILETMGVLAMASMVVGFLLHSEVFFGLAFLLLLSGIFFKRISALIARAWLRFSSLLGALNGRVILTVIFFLVLTPIALLYRAINGDTMKLRRKSLEGSLWTARDHPYEAKDLENTW